jgi:5-methylcytosine-specific restriction enzyme subunit McrC
VTIPIRNVYYLLCYAWDKLEESRVVAVEASDYEHLVNLFARVLSSGLEHLLKRGLDQGYQEHREVVAGVRGKIDFAASVKAHLFPLGRAACVFEELTHDVLHNRILKRTSADLLRADELDTNLGDALRTTLSRMTEVSDIRLDAAAFGRVQLHSNNGVYDFLLRVCRLIHEARVVDEETGRWRFRDFTREKGMESLYERFLLNFYRRKQHVFRARSEVLHWQATFGEPQDLEYLPTMRTDVSLESAARKIVIDAKYYREGTQSYFAKDSVRSGHLYQLFAYLKNLEPLGGVNANAEGILLYPLVDAPLDLRFIIQGHGVRVATIDLAQEWREIHRCLLDLIAPPSAAGSEGSPERLDGLR